MKRKQILTISVAGIAVILFLGLVYYINENSGVNPPFTVVESQSMQHLDDQSAIGTIDTGDMIYVKSPEKTVIVTYVDGIQSGYKSFGDYGSVIIYKRTGGNPVIHRAILWVEWDGTSWNVDSLNTYPYSWDIDGGHTCTGFVSGTLHMTIKSDYRDIVCSLNFASLNTQSGYITLGDHNGNFDQSTGIMDYQPIRPDMVKSVASMEVPWLGCLKLLANGKGDRVDIHAPNSITCLEVTFATIILILIAISYIIDEINYYRISKKI